MSKKFLVDITMERFSSLLDLFQRLGESHFLASYRCPFFVVLEEPAASDTNDLLQVKTIESKTANFQTTKAGFSANPLLPLHKSDRNVFASRITIGRAPNNDVVLSHKKISRLHAVLIIPKEGEKTYCLMDMGSANGTFLNSAKLRARKREPLRNGDKVAIWRFVFEFITAEGILSALRQASSKSV